MSHLQSVLCVYVLMLESGLRVCFNAATQCVNVCVFDSRFHLQLR